MKNNIKTTFVKGIEFEELNDDETELIGTFKEKTVYALTIAAAGRLNIIFVGAPGCGKTLLMTKMPLITPLLTPEESISTSKVWSKAQLLNDELMKRKPFRMPHQTATIEGMCGGGINCMPGEISLAHNGTLFLDETHEFRTSVIQMLRVPIESHSITLSRAGDYTVYPAHFQLAMATNPCPCGNYATSERICLCSARSIEQYWKKISGPLLDRIDIHLRVEPDEKTNAFNIDELRLFVANAYKAQRIRGFYNADMTPDDIQHYCILNKESTQELNLAEERYGFSPRAIESILKIARTIADMHECENIDRFDIKEAIQLRKSNFIEY